MVITSLPFQTYDWIDDFFFSNLKKFGVLPKK